VNLSVLSGKTLTAEITEELLRGSLRKRSSRDSAFFQRSLRKFSAPSAVKAFPAGIGKNSATPPIPGFHDIFICLLETRKVGGFYSWLK
jgi:hypothetical protein